MKRLATILVLLGLNAISLWATPEFAREQKADCSVCHNAVPMLNETGKSFLRNGFKFSPDEKTSLKKFLSPEEGESRHIPFAAMLGGHYNSETEEFNPKVKLYAGGSITNTISFFGVTQETFNTDDKANAPEFFTQKGSRAYFQINLFKENKHVIRAGLISPFTQIGNIQKSSSDSALKGNNNTNTNNHSTGTNIQSKGHRAVNNTPQGTPRGSQDQQKGNQHYKTPLQNAMFNKFKGIEYSYILNQNWFFLLSYGKKVEENGNSHNNHSSQLTPGKGMGQGQNSIQSHPKYDPSNDQFITGFRYTTTNSYNIGLFCSIYEDRYEETAYSLIVPIEKEFEKFTFNSTLIYKNNNTDDYYGIENAVTYLINPSMYLRGIINADQDEENNNNYGYSMTYGYMYKTILMHLTLARKDTKEQTDNIIQLSFNLFL